MFRVLVGTRTANALNKRADEGADQSEVDVIWRKIRNVCWETVRDFVPSEVLNQMFDHAGCVFVSCVVAISSFSVYITLRKRTQGLWPSLRKVFSRITRSRITWNTKTPTFWTKRRKKAPMMSTKGQRLVQGVTQLWDSCCTYLDVDDILIVF
jgi:hypothetical protein